MIELVEKHLDIIITEYNSVDRRREHLMRAKEIYFTQTGMIDEDSEDFDIRMNNFYEWFIFNFEYEDGKTIIGRYLDENQIESEVREALENIEFSIFEFLKINFRKQTVIKNILKNQKFILPEDHVIVTMLPGDIFICRFVTFDGKKYMLRGSTSVTTAAKSNIMKKAKSVRRYSDPKDELDFLIQIQYLQNKAMRYAHIDPSKVFQFTE
jgi:hypothetical protein